MLNQEVLKLNAGFIATEIISVKDALCLIFTDKAYTVIEEENKFVHSPSVSIRIPSVISMKHYNDFPKRRVAFSKLNVIYRDDQICQYCGKHFSNVEDLTVDHIVPKSRWNKEKKTWKKDFTSWTNLVCSCKECNYRKGNKLLKELEWKLLRDPFEPKYLPYLTISKKKAEDKGWLPFCKFNVRLIMT